MGDLKDVMESKLFDLQEDYEQNKPLVNEELEQKMCKKLMAGMKEAQAPEEQYERLGLTGGVV